MSSYKLLLELCVLGIAYAVGNAFAWSTYVTVHYICHR